MRGKVQTGIECLVREPTKLGAAKRIGLITNQTGVTAELESTISVLRRLLGDRFVALFGPEHGLYGHIQDRERIDDGIDRDTGLPVHSLYGHTESPTDEVLRDIDLLIFDIQDVGVRFYTFLTSLIYTLKAAATAGIPVMVLDRPNPITGMRIQGPLIQSDLRSFEGASSIPIRHGMTLGELALLLNRNEGIEAEVEIVFMTGWRRSMWYEQTGLQWVPPSPNMPTVDTAVVYPGMCLFEGTNISEGRGTTRPFELIGAPWMASNQLASALNDKQMPGVRFRPATFRPTFWKQKDCTCHGVQIHVMDRENFDPLYVSLSMISQILELWASEFEWIQVEGDSQFFFDRLIGNHTVRKDLSNGVSPREISDGFLEAEAMFRDLSLPFLHYDG